MHNQHLKDIRDEILAGVVIDRNFDIPISIYDLLDESVIALIITKLTAVHPDKWFFDQYSDNEQARTFFNYARETISRRTRNHKNIIKTTIMEKTNSAEFGLKSLLYRPSDWKSYQKKDIISVQANMISLNLAISNILDYPTLYFQLIPIYDELRDDFTVAFGSTSKRKFVNYLIKSQKSTHTRVENITKLAYYFGFNRNYHYSSSCLDQGIPVLWENYDIIDLWRYLQTVLESEYRGLLDERILNFKAHGISVSDYDEVEYQDITKYLWEIGNTLNQNNLKYYYIFCDRTEKPELMMKVLTTTTGANAYGYKMTPEGYLKDFNDLIIIGGHNKHGFSIELQMLFLSRSGNIETMFDQHTGRLLEEATIIKMMDQLPALMEQLSMNRLRYLIYHSPEFVKNIMLSSWLTTAHLIYITRTLLTVPVDEQLWKLINEDATRNSGEPMDYKAILIDRIANLLSRDVLFDNVPEAMAYIEPDVKYVVKNMTPEKFVYVPVDKLTPFLKTFIAQYPYRRLNLFCKGKWVSIQTAVGDPDFIIDMVVKHKKYSYICDMNCDDMATLIGVLTDKIAERK